MTCRVQERTVGRVHPSGCELDDAAGAPPGLLSLTLTVATAGHGDQHTGAERRYVGWRTASAASAPSTGKSSCNVPFWLRIIAEDAAWPSCVSQTVTR